MEKVLPEYTTSCSTATKLRICTWKRSTVFLNSLQPNQYTNYKSATKEKSHLLFWSMGERWQDYPGFYAKCDVGRFDYFLLISFLSQLFMKTKLANNCKQQALYNNLNFLILLLLWLQRSNYILPILAVMSGLYMYYTWGMQAYEELEWMYLSICLKTVIGERTDSEKYANNLHIIIVMETKLISVYWLLFTFLIRGLNF